MSLRLYVLYDHPSDHPDYIVIRAATIGLGEVRMDAEPLAFARDVEEARRALPPGLHRIPRAPGDDPVILETWL